MIPMKDNIPTDRLPIVTLLLIAANVVVYFLLQHGGFAHGPTQSSVLHYGAIPAEVTRQQPDDGPVPAWVTLFTAMFMHGGILHLAGDVLFLWIFGINVEDSMSRVRFVAFYLLGGLCASGLLIALDPGSTAPAIGASGAIAAVVGGYVVLHPRARVVTVVFALFSSTLIEVPVWLLVGLWFVMQAAFAATSAAHPAGGSGGVAYFGQVGGFAFGLLAIRAFAQRRKRLPSSASAAERAEAVLS